jgi:membrane-associated protein
VEWIRKFFETVYNVPELIRWGGYIGLFAIVFAETGLFVGFFLPGDSLLVTAGLFAAAGELNIFYLNGLLLVAAVAGNATGYAIGHRMGHAIFNKPNSLFFRREHLLRTKRFYEKHGGKTIILAQFMPIVRTFAPVVAGVAGMTYRRFASFNVIGALCWVPSMTLTGYFLGRLVPNIDRHIHYVVAVVIAVSLLPGAIAWLKEKRGRTTESLPEA